MSFGWNNLASNQMVSFTDAQGSPFSLKAGQSPVTSEQCMTKDDVLAKYNVNPSSFNAYAGNQLVPKGAWTAATVYQSAIYSESATKNSCGAGGTGSSVTLTATLGQFTSLVSQGDANAQAVTWVQANKQSYANTNGTCTWYSAYYSESATKNNCAGSGAGSSATFASSAGSFSSNVSQADADAQAVAYVQAGKQAYANSVGYCTWSSTYYSESATKNDCAGSGIGSSSTFDSNAGRFTSIISQADADAQAVTYVQAGKQAYANGVGYCTWYNPLMSGDFDRNNCGLGYTGSVITYSVSAGAYSSNASQADANQQAQNDIDANGQSYANTYGTCTLNSISCGTEASYLSRTDYIEQTDVYVGTTSGLVDVDYYVYYKTSGSEGIAIDVQYEGGSWVNILTLSMSGDVSGTATYTYTYNSSQYIKVRFTKT